MEIVNTILAKCNTAMSRRKLRQVTFSNTDTILPFNLATSMFSMLHVTCMIGNSEYMSIFCGNFMLPLFILENLTTKYSQHMQKLITPCSGSLYISCVGLVLLHNLGQ